MASTPSRVLVTGPLSSLAAGFAAELAGLGYTPLSAANQLRVLAHASRWLQAQQLEAGEFTPERAALFLRDRRAEGYTCWLSERGLAPLLGYLRGAGVVPGPACAPPCTAADVLLERYRGYLVSERGLAASTVRYYLAEARLFVAEAGPDLGGLTAAEVTGFVAAQCRQRTTGAAKILVTALRSLLRFLHLEGLIAAVLVAGDHGAAQVDRDGVGDAGEVQRQADGGRRAGELAAAQGGGVPGGAG
jgi:integrase/recombinase XerD